MPSKPHARELIAVGNQVSRISRGTSAGRLVGWPDGTVYAVDPNGEAFEISSDPEIVAMIVDAARRKHGIAPVE